jgi:biofilm PGA synthesis lipoprotein PgaB
MVLRLSRALLLLTAFVAAGCQTASDKPAARSPAVSTGDKAPDVAKDPVANEISFKCLAQRVPVIMYHDIVEQRGRGSVWFDCTVEEFEDQMKTIQDRGYRPVSLDDLHKHLTEGTPLPDKAIVLTFDDNYQGFYDVAWPILKADGFPAAIFVHTGYVGKKTGRAHMSWETLQALCQNPIITVGSHTISHPDLTTVTPDALQKELTESKSDLETHLNRRIDYFAYPDGKNNTACQAAAKDAGYTMSFSIANGPAEESPNIECVNRYIQTRLDRAFTECERSMEGAAGVYLGPIKSGPVTFKEQEVDGKILAIVSGGTPTSIVSPAREAVLDFMHRSQAVAGINGTFFDMAAISSADNKLVGPCRTPDSDSLIADGEPFRWPKIRNRPLVMWGPTQAAIVPYSPPLMNDDAQYKALIPDVTDVFLAGAWLVHEGKARSRDDIQICSSKDAEDPRRRAAFGFFKDGTPFAAASKDSVSSSNFAEMLEAAGVQEAVLLDSGFSTSLVYGEKVMASGHSTATEPSRPVPHAIVFKGDLDPASQAAAAAAVPATDAVTEETQLHRGRLSTHRRRRRRRARSTPETAAPSVTLSPDPSATPPPPPPQN